MTIFYFDKLLYLKIGLPALQIYVKFRPIRAERERGSEGQNIPFLNMPTGLLTQDFESVQPYTIIYTINLNWFKTSYQQNGGHHNGYNALVESARFRNSDPRHQILSTTEYFFNRYPLESK